MTAVELVHPVARATPRLNIAATTMGGLLRVLGKLGKLWSNFVSSYGGRWFWILFRGVVAETANYLRIFWYIHQVRSTIWAIFNILKGNSWLTISFGYNTMTIIWSKSQRLLDIWWELEYFSCILGQGNSILIKMLSKLEKNNKYHDT